MTQIIKIYLKKFPQKNLQLKLTLEIRYLKNREEAKEDSFPTISLGNKTIGLKYLEESASGNTLFSIIKEKIFDLGDKIKKNFVGITHDHAKSMIGEGTGLISFLRKEFPDKFIFSLKDPCHALNLAVKHSLDSLSDTITDFIEDLTLSLYLSSKDCKAV